MVDASKPRIRVSRFRSPLVFSLLILLLGVAIATTAAGPPLRLATVATETLPTGKEAAPAAPLLAPVGSSHFDPSLAASQAFDREVEPNNNSATATPLTGTNTVVLGTVFPNADLDFFSFTGAAGDRIYAAVQTSVSANGSTDSQLDVLDVDGTTSLEFDEDNGIFGGLSSTIAGVTLPAAGTYYVRVKHFSATNQLRPYYLHFQQRSGSPTPETEPNDALPGQPLPVSGWVSGSTSATTDLDFYSINLNAGDTVFISLDLDPERDTVEWNGQTGIGVFNGFVLVGNDAGGAGPDSEAFFMTVQAAGTYSILVNLPTGGTTFGTYHLSVSVHPATPEGVNCTTYTSTNVPQVIPTGPGMVSSTLTVPGNPRIADLDVSIQLDHAFMPDLDVHLISPQGNDNGLFTDIGASTQQLMNMTLDDEAGVPIGAFTVVAGPQYQPELAYRLGWFDGEDAGGTWTLTIRDDAAGDGGNLTGWSLTICEPPPPPACAPGFAPVTVYSSDFEMDDGGFTHSGVADEWERGLPTFNPITTCNSGTGCWVTDLDNTYNASSNQDLLSPNVNLAGLMPPVLVRWSQRYQMESASFDHYSVDFRQVGMPANSVRLFEWLDATMTNIVGNPTVTIQESAGWGRFERRADAFAGLNTELLFHVDTDTSVQLAGVAIDDVSVTACRGLMADLSITKTDGATTEVPGTPVTYTITASNAGPDPAAATVADTFPGILSGCTWTCVGAGGGTCTAGGSGNINDPVNLPAGASVTYTATCNISAAATGSLTNTATVSSMITDPNPANNSATDTDTLAPEGDLAITKTDGLTTANPGQAITYTIVASNPGPSNAPSQAVTDTFPAALMGITWTCVGAGGGTCTAGGAGNIADNATLPAGGSVTYTVNATISGAFTGTLTNTATIGMPLVQNGGPPPFNDPNPANNSATDNTEVIAQPASVSGTKEVSGDFTPGGMIAYVVVLTNAGPGNQGDNPGDEFNDVLPAEVDLVSATATSGTVVATLATNTVTWNGSLAAGASVTITIDAVINPAASGSIFNQGSISFDGDGDGTNEASAVTDDPTTVAGGDATELIVGGGQSPLEIPTLSPVGLVLLTLVLLAVACLLLRRGRRTAG